MTTDWYSLVHSVRNKNQEEIMITKGKEIIGKFKEHIHVTVKTQDEIDYRSGLLIPIPGGERSKPLYLEIEVRR